MSELGDAALSLALIAAVHESAFGAQPTCQCARPASTSRFIAGLVREHSGGSFGDMLMTFTTDRHRSVDGYKTSAGLCALAAERFERTHLVRLCRGAG